MKALVLVVDDEIGALTLIGIMLDRSGFDVLKAKDFGSALDVLNKTTPELIVTDVMMPGRDGIDLVRMIRTRYETAVIPLLILSARGDADSVMRGMEAGANDYLPKPILHHDLAAKVSSMLGYDKLWYQKFQRLKPEELKGTFGLKYPHFFVSMAMLTAHEEKTRGKAVLGLAHHYKSSFQSETGAQQIFWSNIRHKADGTSPEQLEELLIDFAAYTDLARIYTLPKDTQNQALRDLFSKSDESQPKLLIDIIAAIGYNQIDEVDRLIAVSLNDNQQIREVSIRALGMFAGEKVIQRLADALQDSSSSVSLEAANSLAKIGSQEALERLAKQLENGDKNIRFAIIGALRDVPITSIVDMLLNLVRQETEPNVLFVMMQLLGKVRDERIESVKATLKEFLNHEHSHVRRGASEALADLEYQE